MPQTAACSLNLRGRGFRFSRRSLSSNSRLISRVSVCSCSASCSSAARAHISCHLSLVWCGAIKNPLSKTKMFSRLGCTVFSNLLLDSKPCLSNTAHSDGKLPDTQPAQNPLPCQRWRNRESTLRGRRVEGRLHFFPVYFS